MGGGESKKRAEEEREAASALRREIREKELKEERLAFFEDDLDDLDDPDYDCDEPDYEPGPNLSSSLTMSESEEEEEKEEEEVKTLLSEEDERTEEEREAASAKRREIRKMELKEECSAFIERRAGSPAPSCLSLKSDRSRDSPPLFSKEPGPSDTKDPVINAGTDLDSIFSLLRENIVDYVDDKLNKLIRFLTNDPEGLESQGEYEEGLNVKEEAQRRESTEGFLKTTLDFLRMNQEELADSKSFSSLEEEREVSPASSSESMMSDRSMDFPVSVIRQHLSTLEPDPIIPLRAEEETEDSPLRREIRELVSMGESIALIWQRLSSLEPRPQLILRTEEEREAASALRREIMELPSMEERLAFIELRFSSLEPRPIILSDLGEGVIPGEEEADSPAPSCDSMMSNRSKD